ncbi:MAG: lysophospholipid acyltransferase family protein [Fidelibacterota bacterium]
MNPVIVLLMGLIVILVALAVHTVGKVEAHKDRSMQGEKGKPDLFSAVLSLVLWPFALVAFVVSMTVLISLMFLVPPRHLHPLVRFFSRYILISTGAVLRVKGKERLRRSRAYILMPNHQSILDVFILGAVVYRYMTGLGAAYQFDLPLWGTVLRRWGIIPIPRNDLPKAIESIDLARQKLQAGIPVMVAPEGTRTLDGRIAEFKKGPFHLSLGSRADIIPMLIHGAFEIKPMMDWRLHPGVIRVEIGDVIPYEEYRKMSVEELRDHVRNRLRRMAGEIL